MSEWLHGTYDLSFGFLLLGLSVFLVDHFLQLLLVPVLHRVCTFNRTQLPSPSLERPMRTTPTEPTLTFLQFVLPDIDVDAALLTLPVETEVVRELTLVSFRTLALFEEGTQH